MLNEFFVDNFKSLINVTFRPAEVNLLIGANNSGKTTLCQALQFLGASAAVPLDNCADYAAGGRFGITNFYFQKPTIDFQAKATVPYADGDELHFQYNLSIVVENGTANQRRMMVEEESLRVTGGRFNDTVLLENKLGKIVLLHETAFLNGSTQYVTTSAPRETTMINRLYDLETNERANLFKTYLTSWQYYSFHPEALRLPNHKPNITALASNGCNLASVIFRLKTENERSYRRLLKHLQTIDPRIDVINFVQAGEDQIFMFFEDKDRNRLPASGASEGTMRFLALIYVLTCQPPAAAPPLLMIEEPENGLYVGLLKELMELLGEGQNSPQVIFTTHSPYFIDLFDNRLDGLFVLKCSEQNSRLEQPDPEQIRKRLEEFPLGEQHFREMFQ